MSKESRSPLSQALAENQKWFNLQKEEALYKVIALKETKVSCRENL